MTRPFAAFEELRALLDALCEETIAPEQVQRLEELVLTDPEAEAHYVQYMSQYADLAGRFGTQPARVEQSLADRLQTRHGDTGTGRRRDTEIQTRTRRFRFYLSPRLLVSVSSLAAGLLLVLALWQPKREVPTTANLPPEALDNTVAVLLQASGAEWEDTGLPTRAGAPLPPGWLHLKSGFAHLEFYCGAVVILEGPAEFQLVSRTRAYCARGKLRASVPPSAQGFTIGSPKWELVDRGTEFGLQVGADDRTEVHVFQGKVDVYDPGANRQTPRHELTTGQGVRLEEAGQARPVEPDPAAFRTAQYLTTRSVEDSRRRHLDWLAASEALRKDPSLLVYYPFQAEQPWSRTVLDQARGRLQPRDGAIVGCAWGTGRWPGKQGLEFKQVSDRVRFHVPGEFDSLTLMTWVRVDALPNRNNSLMMTDGWEEGELHWQIGNNGMIILGVQSSPKGRGAHYHAPSVLTPDRFGRWVHLAVVYDREAGQVTHYADGRPTAREPLLFDIPLRLGDVQLGNWDLAKHRNNTPVRFLTGCMDEFLLFARALSDQEIEQLCSQGQPVP